MPLRKLWSARCAKMHRKTANLWMLLWEEGQEQIWLPQKEVGRATNKIDRRASADAVVSVLIV